MRYFSVTSIYCLETKELLTNVVETEKDENFYDWKDSAKLHPFFTNHDLELDWLSNHLSVAKKQALDNGFSLDYKLFEIE